MDLKLRLRVVVVALMLCGACCAFAAEQPGSEAGGAVAVACESVDGLDVEEVCCEGASDLACATLPGGLVEVQCSCPAGGGRVLARLPLADLDPEFEEEEDEEEEDNSHGYCPASCRRADVERMCRGAPSVSCSEHNSRVRVSCDCGGVRREAELDGGRCSGRNNRELPAGESCDGRPVRPKHGKRDGFCPAACTSVELDRICAGGSGVRCKERKNSVKVQCRCGGRKVKAKLNTKNGKCKGHGNEPLPAGHDCGDLSAAGFLAPLGAETPGGFCPASCGAGELEGLCRGAQDVACVEGPDGLRAACVCGDRRLSAERRPDGSCRSSAPRLEPDRRCDGSRLPPSPEAPAAGPEPAGAASGFAGVCPASCGRREVERICRGASSMTCGSGADGVRVECECGGRRVEAHLDADGACSGHNNAELLAWQTCEAVGGGPGRAAGPGFCPASCSPLEVDTICRHARRMKCEQRGGLTRVVCSCGGRAITAERAPDGTCSGYDNLPLPAGAACDSPPPEEQPVVLASRPDLVG